MWPSVLGHCWMRTKRKWFVRSNKSVRKTRSDASSPPSEGSPMTRRRIGSAIDEAGNELLLIVYAHEVISHDEDGSIIHDIVRREIVTETVGL